MTVFLNYAEMPSRLGKGLKICRETLGALLFDRMSFQSAGGSVETAKDTITTCLRRIHGTQSNLKVSAITM